MKMVEHSLVKLVRENFIWPIYLQKALLAVRWRVWYLHVLQRLRFEYTELTSGKLPVQVAWAEMLL